MFSWFACRAAERVCFLSKLRRPRSEALVCRFLTAICTSRRARHGWGILSTLCTKYLVAGADILSRAVHPHPHALRPPLRGQPGVVAAESAPVTSTDISSPQTLQRHKQTRRRTLRSAPSCARCACQDSSAAHGPRRASETSRPAIVRPNSDLASVSEPEKEGSTFSLPGPCTLTLS